MSEQHEQVAFVVTKGYQLFADLCDACRRFRSIGLGYGPPGTGKTESARQYAQWKHLEPFMPENLITFTGRSAADGFFPYKPFTFSSLQASTPLQDSHVGATPPSMKKSRIGEDASPQRSAPLSAASQFQD